MENTEDKSIYVITVFSKLESNYIHPVDIGERRTVGFRYDLDVAKETVMNNMCDIWEYSYDYACIEKLGQELYSGVTERYLFQFNQSTGTFDEITVPDFVRDFPCNFCTIG